MQTCSTTILPVAQLVERETVRVALYLEVACSTQALENPFVSLLILFPPVCGISCERRCSSDMESPFQNLRRNEKAVQEGRCHTGLNPQIEPRGARCFRYGELFTSPHLAISESPCPHRGDLKIFIPYVLYNVNPIHAARQLKPHARCRHCSNSSPLKAPRLVRFGHVTWLV